MKTADEIVERIKTRKDVLGFGTEALIEFLSFDEAKPLLKPETKPEEWIFTPLTREGVIDTMRKYMEFAWGKAIDHRGISAGRSVEKMCQWLWILEDHETLTFAEDDTNYPNYGVPILRKISQRYEFPIPDGVRTWKDGEPCEPNCQNGCG